MRPAVLLGSHLGVLLVLSLAACELDYTIELYSICHNDAGVEVPCCGPPGEKYACPPDGGDDAEADAGDGADADADDDDGGPEAGSSSWCPEHAQCVSPG